MSLEHSAQSYASTGWRIFPAHPKTKRPLIKTGKDHAEHASSDEEQIALWWRNQFPGSSIACPTGAANGVVVIDADRKHDGEGLLAELEAALGPLPREWSVRTQSGGLHVYLAHPGAGTRIKSTSAQLGKLVREAESGPIGVPGVDIRADGGIVLLPPSPGYKWVSVPKGSPPPLPEAWRKALTAKPKAELDAAPGADISEGGRNAMLASLAGTMRSRGMGHEAIAMALHAENRARCAPPLPADEVDTIAASIASYEAPPDEERIFNEAFPAAFQAQVTPAPQPAPAGPIRKKLSTVAAQDKPPIRTYPTKLAQYDHLTGGGLATRQLTILLGPPGSGKSAWLVDMANRMLETIPVLYVSTELESDELVARFAAPVVRAPWRDIVRDRVDKVKVQSAVADLQVEVIGSESLPRGEQAMPAIAREAKAMAEEHGVPPLIIVDYLQDLARGGSEKELRGRVGDIACGFRVMSQSLDCAIIAASSVSRSWYSASKAEVMRASDHADTYLSAAKESGDVDYAAAVVAFIDLDKPSSLARLALAKVRHGETGFVGLKFDAPIGTWADHPSAIMELSGAGRAESKRTEDDQADEVRVLEAITAHGERMSWTDLRELAGCRSNGHAGRARARLLAAGKIELRQVAHPKTRRLVDRWFPTTGRSQPAPSAMQPAPSAMQPAPKTLNPNGPLDLSAFLATITPEGDT